MAEPHALVQLLLKRMESHPEEFSDSNWPQPQSDTFLRAYDEETTMTTNRWGHILNRVSEWASGEENELLKAGMRIIMLDRLHSEAMDELLNGDERRRAREVEMQEAITAKLTAKSVAQNNARLQAAAQSALGAYQQSNTYNQAQALLGQGYNQLSGVQGASSQEIQELNRLLSNHRKGIT